MGSRLPTAQHRSVKFPHLASWTASKWLTGISIVGEQGQPIRRGIGRAVVFSFFRFLFLKRYFMNRRRILK
jgi:hypothetical protein